MLPINSRVPARGQPREENNGWLLVGGRTQFSLKLLRLLMEVDEKGGWEMSWAERKACGSLFLALVER